VPKAPPHRFALTPEERWPYYDEDEIDAVAAVLRSGAVNQWTGADVFAFEAACTSRFGGGFGIAVANGSVALELALRAFGIGPGDEVVVTPRSFVASAFCVLLVGARPVFADVDRDSGNITAKTIEPVITGKTRAIVPVHLAGPTDMPAIMQLARKHGLIVVEDCAQSPGASVEGQPTGSFGDAAAFSFCQDKIITTGGEGGFVSFKDEAAYEWAWSFKDHGKNRAKALSRSTEPGEFRWLHESIGTNWRLTGPQAAIGLLQLGKLDDWLGARARNAQIWKDALRHVAGIRIPEPPLGTKHAYYKLYLYLDVAPRDAEKVRREILRRASADHLRIFSGSCSEIYRELALQELPRPDCPQGHRLGQNSLMVEVHPTLRADLLERRAERFSAILCDVLS
jgi:dTDP-4-amino-4,6-dideoxygalactose transaminase